MNKGTVRSSFLCTVALFSTAILSSNAALADAFVEGGFWKKSCEIYPSEKVPSLQWCKSKFGFTYDILTWNESEYFGKRRLEKRIRNEVRHWLNKECQDTSLKTNTVTAQLWLAVPRSGAEIAAPRISIQLDNQNLAFANAWNEEWILESDNLHILGKQTYDEFSGTSLSGNSPEKLLFKLKEGKDLEETSQFLFEHGITVESQVSNGLQIYRAAVNRYSESEKVDQIRNSPESKQFIEWIEPSFRLETISDNFLLHSFELSSRHIPSSCKIKETN